MANLKKTNNKIEYAMKQHKIKQENSYEIFATVISVVILESYSVRLKLHYTNERGTEYFFETELWCDNAFGCKLNDKDFKDIEKVLIGKKVKVIVDTLDRSKYVVDNEELNNDYQQYMNELVKRPEQIEFVNQNRKETRHRDTKILVPSAMFLGGALIIVISAFFVNDIPAFMYIGLTLTSLSFFYLIIGQIVSIFKRVIKVKNIEKNGVRISGEIQSASFNTEYDGEGLSSDYITFTIKYLDVLGNIYFTKNTIHPKTGCGRYFNEASFIGRQVVVYVDPNDYNECVVDRNSIPKI